MYEKNGKATSGVTQNEGEISEQRSAAAAGDDGLVQKNDATQRKEGREEDEKAKEDFFCCRLSSPLRLAISLRRKDVSSHGAFQTVLRFGHATRSDGDRKGGGGDAT